MNGLVRLSVGNIHKKNGQYTPALLHVLPCTDRAAWIAGDSPACSCSSCVFNRSLPVTERAVRNADGLLPVPVESVTVLSLP